MAVWKFRSEYLLLRLTVRVMFVDGYDMGLGYYYKATYFLGSL